MDPLQKEIMVKKELKSKNLMRKKMKSSMTAQMITKEQRFFKVIMRPLKKNLKANLDQKNQMALGEQHLSQISKSKKQLTRMKKMMMITLRIISIRMGNHQKKKVNSQKSNQSKLRDSQKPLCRMGSLAVTQPLNLTLSKVLLETLLMMKSSSTALLSTWMKPLRS